MALIVNPSSGVDWTLTRERIADKALEKCGRLGIGRAASASDRSLCLEALDSVLKNLLWHGYAWPKTASSSTTLTFTAGLTSQALPQDFYNLHTLNYVDASGNEIGPIPMDDPPTWNAIVLKSTQAQYPTEAFIDNANTLWLYPVPSATLTLKLYYQKVVNDSVASSAADLDSPWMLGLVYGVAAEIGDEFSVDPARLARFEAKWREQRDLGIMNEAPPGPDRIQVSD